MPHPNPSKFVPLLLPTPNRQDLRHRRNQYTPTSVSPILHRPVIEFCYSHGFRESKIKRVFGVKKDKEPPPSVQDVFNRIIEKQMLTAAKVVKDKIDDEIVALDRLDVDDLEALREYKLQQMKKMVEKRNRWISLGHGEYSEIHHEKEFFFVVKATKRIFCHFYHENWPCKVCLRIYA